MKKGEREQSCIIARVMMAGVGQPVGVSGRIGMLVIVPFMISSESRIGVKTVFSGEGPAPDMPGTVDSMVFASIGAKTGLSGE
jgi:hypothetical protein